MRKPVRPSAKGRAPAKKSRTAKVGRIQVSKNDRQPTRSRSVSKQGISQFALLKSKLSKQSSSNVIAFKSRPREARIVVITLLASVAALVLLVLATAFTPLLAVERIRISGLANIPQSQIEKAVANQIGTPLPLVSQQKIADQLAKFSLIESFTLVSELPHTLHIAISERQPICIVDVKGVSYLYDPAGIRLGEASYKDKYPRVLIVGEPKNSESFDQAIEVLLALPADLLPGSRKLMRNLKTM